MIADLFPNLEPCHNEPVADTGRQSAAPAETRTLRIQAESLSQPVTPGVRSDRLISLDVYARKLVAKEIVALLPDLPSPTRFQKYLEKQSLEDLQARRQQLQSESQRDFQFYAATQRRMPR